jgi:hypothetical protein
LPIGFVPFFRYYFLYYLNSSLVNNLTIFIFCAAAPSGPEPPHSRGF